MAERLPRVLVCGDRLWSNGALVERELRRLGRVTVVEGECRGADALGRDAALRLGLPVEGFPADWRRYGRAAGPIRNAAMLASGIDRVLAFHNDLATSRGTADMVRRAKRAGVAVTIVTEKEER